MARDSALRGATMNAFIRTSIVVLLAVWAVLPGHAAALTISTTFHFRENSGPNPFGIPEGDLHLVGAVTITPSGAGTMASAAQAGTVVALGFLPQTLFPDQYVARFAFDPTLTGPWEISATRGADTAGPVATNAIVSPKVVPLVGNVQILGTGLTPLIAWDLPDLSELDFSTSRIRIRAMDATNGDALAQFTAFTQFPPFGGGPELGRSMIVPAGLLQYGRSYVFRIMLEDLVVPNGAIQNRSSTYSAVYTPTTIVTGAGFTLFSDRGVFEEQLGTRVVDDYENPGYDVNPTQTQPDVLSDAAMTAVLGETRYTTTQYPDSNVIVPGADHHYCGGCNGTFLLIFDHTSVGQEGTVFGAGFDVARLVNNSVWTEHTYALITFGDGGTASVPLGGGFVGVTAGPRGIRSIHVGEPDGSPSSLLYVEIDNLTIGDSPVMGVSIDIKPGEAPNTINLHSHGNVPVAILSTATFDARRVDPSTVTLAGAPVVEKSGGRLMVSVEDVNGDGLPDLVVHFATAALGLSATDTQAVLEGRAFDGRAIRGVDSVIIVP
jgi:hypothetical protein